MSGLSLLSSFHTPTPKMKIRFVLRWIQAYTPRFPPPRSCIIVFLDSEKMTFLENVDMYLVVLVIFSYFVILFCQYLAIVSL